MAHKITRIILGEEVTVFWNHRILSRTEAEETNLYIVEVYYDADGATIGWTEGHEVYGTSVDELHQTLTWMLESLNKPILDESVLLAEAEVARQQGDLELFPSEHLTIDEVLDSLGLDRSDLGDIVEHSEEPLQEESDHILGGVTHSPRPRLTT